MAKAKQHIEKHYRVVKMPLLTEKVLTPSGPEERDDDGEKLGERRQQYGFVVDRNANKIEIKNAIEAIFDVKVERVRTAIQKGKYHRSGWRFIKEPPTKKAIVTLAPGDAIDLF